MKKGLSRKGQLSLFVLLGILIIISALIYYYYRQEIDHVRPPVVVPPELVPLQLYVQSCMDDVAENAVRLIGTQGGYIHIPAEIERRPQSYIKLDPQGYFKSPLWYYRGRTQVPNVDVVASQMNEYIAENIGHCLNNFTAFSAQYDVNVLDAPQTKTLFTSEDIEVRMVYPLRVQALFGNRTRSDIQDFVITVPVRMKKIIETAIRIAEEENSLAFIENVTLDLMAGSPDVPFTNMEFRCGVRRWRTSDVRRHVQDLISYNIPNIRIENTRYTPFDAPRETYESFKGLARDDTTGEVIGLPDTALPQDAYYYFHMLRDIGMREPDLRIGFSYEPRWGMHFVAYPSHDGIMKSKNAKGSAQYLGFLCIDVYHFAYDVVYPLQISITDAMSYNGEGYTYSFFMPVQIKQNRAAREDIGVTYFDVPDQERDICANLGGDVLDIRAAEIFAGIPSAYLDAANISVECVTDSCLLGMTSAQSGNYQLSSRLPAGCAYPFITAHKEGYLPGRIQLTDPGQGYVEVPMQKLRHVEFEVVKHLYHGDSKTLLPGAIPLEPNENVTISLSVVNGSHNQYAVFPADPQDSQGAMIDLVEDEGIVYKLDILGTKRGYAREYFFGGFSGRWSPQYDEVANARKVVFHVFEYRPTPVKDEEQFRIAGYLDGDGYQDALQPVIE